MTLEPYRILITGSRTTTPEQDTYVTAVLHVAATRPMQAGRNVTVIQGVCPTGGVDRAAEKWAQTTFGAGNEPHPADWRGLGKRAGMVRNAEMVATGADICLAFPGPGSVGTWDCIRKAVAAGIHVRIYPLTSTERQP